MSQVSAFSLSSAVPPPQSARHSLTFPLAEILPTLPDLALTTDNFMKYPLIECFQGTKSVGGALGLYFPAGATRCSRPVAGESEREESEEKRGS